jgi:hypothetical protein
MIKAVLQHLDDLHLELMTIDPEHRTDAIDRVAAIAADLRRTMADAEPSRTGADRTDLSDDVRAVA